MYVALSGLGFIFSVSLEPLDESGGMPDYRDPQMNRGVMHTQALQAWGATRSSYPYPQMNLGVMHTQALQAWGATGASYPLDESGGYAQGSPTDFR